MLAGELKFLVSHMKSLKRDIGIMHSSSFWPMFRSLWQQSAVLAALLFCRVASQIGQSEHPGQKDQERDEVSIGAIDKWKTKQK